MEKLNLNSDKEVINSSIKSMSAQDILNLLERKSKESKSENPTRKMTTSEVKELKKEYVSSDTRYPEKITVGEGFKPSRSEEKNIEPIGATLAVAQSDDTSLTMESIVNDWTSVGVGFPRPGNNVELTVSTGWKSWLKHTGEKIKNIGQNVGQKLKDFFFVPEEESLTEVKNFNKDTAKDLKKQLAETNRQLREFYVEKSWVAKYPWLKEPLRKIENAKASVEGFAVGFLIPMVSRVVLHDPLLSQLAGGTTGMFLKFKLSQMYERAHYSYEDISLAVKEKLNGKDNILSVAACAAFLAKLEKDKKILGDKVDLAKFNRLKNQLNRRLINQILETGNAGCGITIFEDKAGNKIIQSSDLVGKLLKKEVDGMVFAMNADDRKKFETRYSQGLFSSVMANVMTSVIGCAKQPETPHYDNNTDYKHTIMGSPVCRVEELHGHEARSPYDLQERINTVGAEDFQPNTTESAHVGAGLVPAHHESPDKNVGETLAVAQNENNAVTQPDKHIDINPAETIVEHPVKVISHQTDQTPGYHPFETNPNQVKHDSFGNGDNSQPGMGGVNKDHGNGFGTGEEQGASTEKEQPSYTTKNLEKYLDTKSDGSDSSKFMPQEGEKKNYDVKNLWHPKDNGNTFADADKNNLPDYVEGKATQGSNTSNGGLDLATEGTTSKMTENSGQGGLDLTGNQPAVETKPDMGQGGMDLVANKTTAISTETPTHGTSYLIEGKTISETNTNHDQGTGGLVLTTENTPFTNSPDKGMGGQDIVLTQQPVTADQGAGGIDLSGIKPLSPEQQLNQGQGGYDLTDPQDLMNSNDGGAGGLNL